MAIPSRQHAFGLRTCRDLEAKLLWEVEQLEAALSRDDGEVVAYTAFNVAVTVWAMIDWVLQDMDEGHRADFGLPGKDKKGRDDKALCRLRKRVMEACPQLKRCQHIANGSKHAVVERNPDMNLAARMEAVAPRTGGSSRWTLTLHACREIVPFEQDLEEIVSFWLRFVREHDIPRGTCVVALQSPE